MRKIICVSGVSVLELSDLMTMFMDRVDSLPSGESYSLKVSVSCVVDGAGVVADIIVLSESNEDNDYVVASEIVEMVKTLRVNGGGVVSRKIDSMFVLGERMSVELSFEIPHAC